MNKSISVLTIVLILNLTKLSIARIKFTNIKCDELDTKFASFQECDLKVLKRGIVGLNIYVKLYEIPVGNVSLNLAILKKANGYKPFLYNVTTDFCSFMKNRRHNLFLYIFFFEILMKSTNINHTCPYNHDIIVRNLILDESMFRMLPLPTGEYMFNLKVAAYNDWKADVKAYFERIEY